MIPVWWTKRSLPPSSGVMKPKPFESLNHFTVPVAMLFPFHSCARLSELRGGHDDQGRETTGTGTALGGEVGRSLLVSCGAHFSTPARSARPYCRGPLRPPSWESG